MMTTESLRRLEIRHGNYNLSKKDNLDTVPAEKAVFGVFAIVNDEPVNCRYIGETEDLRESVKQLYEQPEGEGLRKFMQGPWIQLLQYAPMPGSSSQERQATLQEWIKAYHPAIDEDGEYPGYY